MTVSRSDYDRLALQVVTTDRRLAANLARACARLRPVNRHLVLFEASLRDALRSTTVSREHADAARLLRGAKKKGG